MSVENNVPEIRFKGFEDEWNTLTLGDLGTVATNKRIFIHQTSLIGDVPFYKIGSFGREPKLFISQELFEDYKKRFPFPLKGDLLFSVIGSIGRVVEYTGEDAYFQDSNIVWLKHDGAIVNSFLKQFYLIVEWQGIEGSTIKHLYNRNILGTQIRMPPREEQTKIGNYFQNLDALINQHQQKHDKLSNIKKAMLEKMFPKQGETIPEIRFKGFSGEWEESNLEKCTDLLTGNPFNSKEFTSEGFFLVRGMNVKRGYLDSSPDISEFWPSSKGLERYLLEPEDIVVQMDGALIGKSYAKIKSINLPAILVQRVTRIRCSEVNSEFIYQYIQKDFLKHISGIKTETAVPHLSLHDIRAFSIFLPEIEEQNTIGNYFQKLDALINQHQQQINKLTNIKQACLSKMFV